MAKSNYEKGLCPDCEGFIQYDKTNDYMYCMDCHKTWDMGEWEWLVEENREVEYKHHSTDENLSFLNNL